MATIFCFSSTGNSLYVSKALASTLNATLLPMTKIDMTCDDSIIGFIFPTYYLGLPKIVSDFISSLKITNPNPYLFGITTCGSISFGVAHQINVLLASSKHSLNYFNNIRSVENYIPSPILFVDDWSLIHKQVDKKLHTISQDLQIRKQKVSNLYTPLNFLMYKLYLPTHEKPFDCNFNVTGCIGCGLCAKICPRQNIQLINQKPSFSGHCEECLACMHVCPQSAINYRHSVGKKRYKHPKISTSELIKFYHS